MLSEASWTLINLLDVDPVRYASVNRGTFLMILRPMCPIVYHTVFADS